MRVRIREKVSAGESSRTHSLSFSVSLDQLLIGGNCSGKAAADRSTHQANRPTNLKAEHRARNCWDERLCSRKSRETRMHYNTKFAGKCGAQYAKQCRNVQFSNFRYSKINNSTSEATTKLKSSKRTNEKSTQT